MHKALDIGCGKGEWSKGLADAGFDCTGIDVADVGYPFDLIKADIRDLDGRDFTGYDVIVGSMPCRDFSRMAAVAKSRKWKVQPDPASGVELVRAMLKFIKDAGPAIWIMENVPGLIKYLPELPPTLVANLAPHMKRAFWGNFPMFLISPQFDRPNAINIGGKHRSWKRAELPPGLAYNFALAAKGSLKRWLA